MNLSIEFLGTGTSNGIPMLGCGCPVCRSENPKNKRLRASILLRQGKTNLIVDTGPDFRTQALRAGVEDLSAILYTHHHADHLHGIDDLRPFGYRRPVPIFAPPSVLAEIRNRFSYFFEEGPKGTSKPKVLLHEIWDQPVLFEDLWIQPIPIFHGPQTILGFRFEDTAYLTDCTGAPEKSLRLLAGVKTVILGALRERPHPTHFSVQEAIDFGLSLGSEKIYLTHICHDIEHKELQARLPDNVFLAYDGLILPEK
jgi:phosphoribosyl 1,2-cyclic phosphate phosphodiesterase